MKKVIIYALRFPIALMGTIALAIFIPLAGMIFAPAGALWALSTTSLIWWPLAKLLFPSIGDKFLDLSYRDRFEMGLAPVVIPLIFGYGILVFGSFDLDKTWDNVRTKFSHE